MQDSLIHARNVFMWAVFLVLCIITGIIIPIFEQFILVGLIVAVVMVITLLRPVVVFYLMMVIWPFYPLINWGVLQNSDPIVRLWQVVLISFGLIGVLLHNLKMRPRRVNANAVDLSVALLFCMGIYTSIISENFESIVFGLYFSYLPVCLYVLARVFLHGSHINRWILLFAVANILLAVVGVYFYFINPSFLYEILISERDINAAYRLGRPRMVSLLGNPLHFGTLMALAAVISLAMSFATRFKALWLICFLVFSLCAWLSQTRGSWIMILTSFAIQMWFYIKYKYNTITATTTVVIGVTGLFAVVFIFYREIALYYLSDSQGLFLNSRIIQWSASIDAIQSALWGNGIGLGHAARRIGNVDAVTVYDGWYLKVLLEGGILGVVIFGAFLLSTISYLITNIHRLMGSRAYWQVVGIVGGFIGFSLNAIVSNVWDYYMVAPIMWILLGIGVNLIEATEH
jgi:O-antigen ligase